VNYYRRFPGDYLKDTVHLTMAQDGAYNRLLDFYYTREKPLPLEVSMIYKMVRANTDEDRSAVDFVLKEFFVLTRWGFVQKRAQQEILMRKNWVKWQKTHRDTKPDNRLTVRPMSGPSPFLSPSPSPSKELREKKKLLLNSPKPGSLSAPAHFLEFWQSYPRKTGKTQALKAWIKKKCDDHAEAILANLEAWKQTEQWSDVQFIPYPATWINKSFCEESPAPGFVIDSSVGSYTARQKEIERKYGL
jgi:uncharacterized protein YdaU (DUF1376 family)